MKPNPIDAWPNYRDEDGKLCIVSCPECGRENYALTVSTGRCCWCGWKEQDETKTKKE